MRTCGLHLVGRSSKQRKEKHEASHSTFPFSGIFIGLLFICFIRTIQGTDCLLIHQTPRQIIDPTWKILSSCSRRPGRPHCACLLSIDIPEAYPGRLHQDYIKTTSVCASFPRQFPPPRFALPSVSHQVSPQAAAGAMLCDSSRATPYQGSSATPSERCPDIEITVR